MNENREMPVALSYVQPQAASAFMRLSRITKEKDSIYKSILGEGLTQEINGDRGSIRWAPTSMGTVRSHISYKAKQCCNPCLREARWSDAPPLPHGRAYPLPHHQQFAGTNSALHL